MAEGGHPGRRDRGGQRQGDRTGRGDLAASGQHLPALRPDKTRLIEFGRHAAANRERRGLGKPETFNFLGFTFICGKSRRGKFLLKRKTRRDRMRAKLQANNQALAAFRFFVTELWQRSLRRRSQKDGTTWQQITQLAKDWLPKPDTLHPWPRIRFAVTHPRWEPYAGKPHVRFCAGGAQQ